MSNVISIIILNPRESIKKIETYDHYHFLKSLRSHSVLGPKLIKPSDSQQL